MDDDELREDAVATTSRYVQFDTTNPPGRELIAAEWVRDQLVSRGITADVRLCEPAPGRGLVVARVAGSEPLKPLLLNHHMDVVAADPAQWTYPPFSGTVAGGYVWGRGTLDDKGLGVVFLLALDLLLKENVRFRRPVVYLAVPDEETGGRAGMGWLVENHLADIDPEWVWDEGSGGVRGVFGDRPLFGVAVAEKPFHHLRLSARGQPGHASMPHANNPNVTLLRALERVLRSPRPMRLNQVTRAMLASISKAQRFPNSYILDHLDNPLIMRIAANRLAADNVTNALLRDTISLTVLRGGYQVNVIPERAEAEIDCRLLPDTDAQEFFSWLRQRIADDRVQVEVTDSSPPSGISPFDSPFYRAVAEAVTRQAPGAGVFPLQVPGATDGRYFRQRGYAAYGFGPFIMTRDDLNRVHGIDERVSAENLLLGIKIARDIIRALCV